MCIHYSGDSFLFEANNIVTVFLFKSVNSGECSQSNDGIIPFFANNNATVSPFLFYILTLCFQDSGGITSLLAKIKATVLPSLFYNSGSWIHYFGGIIP